MLIGAALYESILPADEAGMSLLSLGMIRKQWYTQYVWKLVALCTP